MKLLKKWRRRSFRSLRKCLDRWRKRFSPSVGNIGETVALQYLLAKGYDVVARNFRIGNGELDIISYHGESLVFIEVKTRSRQDAFAPQVAVTLQKEEQIVRLANAFCHRYGLEEIPMRFDVVAITIDQGSAPKVEHFVSAF
ncbi:MAG TPA: YraN family protein [Acidobacteriota bacterium]